MKNREQIHLIHGGHKGTEAEFGVCAGKWGVRETTLSYEGHVMARSENVEVLSDDELEKGRVSMEFVFQRMGRRFVQGKGLNRVIHLLFHVVTRSDQMFAIGSIQENGSVKGGTGWGVELAKLFNRPVHVFDQEKAGWFDWDGTEWKPSEPSILEGNVSVTGTRNLTDAGRQAIVSLFESSLGEQAGGGATS
jgi:hypothetical protein